MIRIKGGDCLAVMAQLAADGVMVDSVVTDPPYHLTSVVKRFGKESAAPAQYGTDGAFARASAGFMGKQWDGGDVAFQPETWAAALALLPPGGHLLAFGGTRTYHRMVCAIEDAGFEVRDALSWVYGSGFPKSRNVGKAIDEGAGVDGAWVAQDHPGRPGIRKKRGAIIGQVDHATTDNPDGLRHIYAPATDAARQWEGWGTALKPAHELIVLARKPLVGTVAANVLAHGTGALNIDGCRVGIIGDRRDPCGADGVQHRATGTVYGKHAKSDGFDTTQRRWPANLVHDGSDEVMAEFAGFGESQSRIGKPRGAAAGDGWGMTKTGAEYADAGSAARFFYCAKAGAKDRAGSKHPTIKPLALMRWLVRLVTPPGGTVLDPFAGSGTTGQAAAEQGFNALLIEREAQYIDDIKRRLGVAA